MKAQLADVQDVSETLSNAVLVLGCCKSSEIHSGHVYVGIFSEENPGVGGKSFFTDRTRKSLAAERYKQ